MFPAVQQAERAPFRLSTRLQGAALAVESRGQDPAGRDPYCQFL